MHTQMCRVQTAKQSLYYRTNFFKYSPFRYFQFDICTKKMIKYIFSNFEKVESAIEKNNFANPATTVLLGVLIQSSEHTEQFYKMNCEQSSQRARERVKLQNSSAMIIAGEVEKYSPLPHLPPHLLLDTYRRPNKSKHPISKVLQ